MNDAPDTTAAGTDPSLDGAGKKKRTIVAVSVALAVILAAGAGVGAALLNQPAATATATATPTPSDSSPSLPADPVATATTPPPPSTASPTPTPTEAPGMALPDDCRSIYTPAFLDIWAGEKLNDPALEDVVISRFDGVEKAREVLPGLECKWGVPTEGGMSTAVNQANSAQKAELVDTATAEGFSCTTAADVTVCAFSEGPVADDPEGWVVSEELYFRDGLVVTTWRASTIGTMADSTQPVYDTLWP